MTHSWISGPIGRVWIGIRHRLSRPIRARAKEIDLPGHGSVRIDKTLNFVGENCLRTILITKLALNKARAGAVVELCSDNLSAIETIPFMLPHCNCDHLATINAPDCRMIYVRKRQKSPLPERADERAGARRPRRETRR